MCANRSPMVNKDRSVLGILETYSGTSASAQIRLHVYGAVGSGDLASLRLLGGPIVFHGPRSLQRGAFGATTVRFGSFPDSPFAGGGEQKGGD